MEWVEKWCGLIEYEKALFEQDEAQDVVKLGNKSFIFGLEHPNTITLGVRGHAQKDIVSTPTMNIVKVRRGGEATIHSPGQLVVYPVVSLKELNIGVRDFVEVLMVTTESLFANFGIQLFRKEEPGLFTEKGKMAFVGIHVNQGITQHGIAINVNNDLSLFSQISVCGVQGEKLDRLSHYEPGISTRDLFIQWSQLFKGNLS